MAIQSLLDTTSLDTQYQSAFPSGVIIIWSGLATHIPKGWYLCNGTNGTPDLRDDFIRQDSSSVLGSGGENFNTLAHSHTVNGTTTTNGAHTHTFNSTTTDTVAGHSHTVSGTTGAPSSTTLFRVGAGTPSVTLATYTHTHTVSATSSTSASHSHTIASSTSDSVSGHSHTVTTGSLDFASLSIDNRPPYYALCYIMKG